MLVNHVSHKMIELAPVRLKEGFDGLVEWIMVSRRRCDHGISR